MHGIIMQKKEPKFLEIQAYHLQIFDELLPGNNDARKRLMDYFDKLKEIVSSSPTFGYDRSYDMVVSFGELFSTTIIAAFLQASGVILIW